MTVAVIGAGLVGLAVAVFAQRAGLDVTAYDLRGPGGGASYGNSGLISVDGVQPASSPGMLNKVPGWLRDPLGPLAVRPAYLPTALPFLIRRIRAGRMDHVLASSDGLRALHQSALELYRQLLGPVHFPELVRIAGAIQILDGDRETPAEQLAHELWRRQGVVPEPLGVDELRQLVPQIAPGITRGLLFTRSGHTVSPLRLAQCLASLLQEAGGAVRGEEVLRIVPDGARWRLITNLGDHRVTRVVVAGGAWSARLLAPLGIKVPLETERGYHVMIRNPSVALRLPLMYRARGFALVPMESGMRLAGTVEIAGLDAAPNEARAAAILEHGRRVLPGLDGEAIDIWMGHRPSTPDSLPVIEEVAGRPGMFLAFGHGHTGVTGAAATGQMVTQMMLKQPLTVDAAPYRLSRFH